MNGCMDEDSRTIPTPYVGVHYICVYWVGMSVNVWVYLWASVWSKCMSKCMGACMGAYMGR